MLDPGSSDRLITTPRLGLGPLTVADAGEMTGVLAGPELYTFIGGEPPDATALRQRYTVLVRGHSADGTEDWFNWVVRLRRADGTPGVAVGYVQATVTDAGTRAEVAWVVGTAWQRRGYASEAAAALVGWLTRQGVDTVVAHVHPEHAASEAVARRCGLVPTGETDEDGEQRWELTVG
ncbi:MAG: GNAT family N-acetyltransferase [Kineosporiaceae bacterium]